MILERCNETLHNGVTELHRQEFSYSAGVSASYYNIAPQKGMLEHHILNSVVLLLTLNQVQYRKAV